ncbi:hypothetical protein PAE9249_05260 [Paenibacillus sp. CECT 9249]|uniref:Ger(x)C family spore germination protein n=1 Tax=Paenibacillus sp. CECT 9249 TaxID=2845385 RepID=UPI001E3E6756|nr:Ger(x)C family spore germination protein [Paenibacillus sp. CECT 9249]CAH0122675.1 hypothetical protein PAE9249_05260 [Paenibacillus sp. CECT 9249]
MIRRTVSVLCCVSMLAVLLSGCWDIKDIQENAYLTALGIDFVDGKYVVYVQSLDFSNVAKQEVGKPRGKAPIWVGKGVGSTLGLAFYDVLSASQLKIVWEHITAIVFSDNIMKQDIVSLLDSILRYREMRNTLWVFGTKEPIDRIFSVSPIFDMSPMLTLLHEPNEVYSQRSYIPSVRLQQFIALLREPGMTVLVPSITINKESWEKDLQITPQLQINGLYAIYNRRQSGWFPEERLRGYRWMSRKTVEAPLYIQKGNAPQIVLTLGRPQQKVTVATKDGKPRFNIKINIQGEVEELLRKMSEAEAERMAEEEIRKHVLQTYSFALHSNTDIYSLRHTLYRTANAQWKKYGKELRLDDNSIDIDVKVKIKHAGIQKL